MFIYIQTMELYLILSMSSNVLIYSDHGALSNSFNVMTRNLQVKSFSLRLCTRAISLVENSMTLLLFLFFFFRTARKIWPGRPLDDLTRFQLDHAVLQIFYNTVLVNSRLFRLGILVTRDGVIKASRLITRPRNDWLALHN